MIRGGVAALVLIAVSAGGGATSRTEASAANRLVMATLTRAVVSAASTPDTQARVLATWCGAASQVDRAPNPVSGNAVHWIYAIPSDGADRLASVASTMQTNAEEIDVWWRGQDPLRVPRNDVATFPCGTQLDLTTVRVSRTGSQLASLDDRFDGIVDSLEAASFRSPFTKYLVYYDGPVSEANVCGQGGSDPTGFGVAVVYFQACAGVSTAAVAAHELLHTLGAVPRAAPHNCTGDTSDHTCDDRSDLMFPSIGGDPLASKVLDPGRDDYYGHPGAFQDMQDSAWLVRLDGQVPLALTISGPGTVSADVPGLLCTTSCTTTWNSGQRLALTAAPSTGARLVRWGSACSGAAGCIVTVGGGTTLSALFAPAAFRLSVGVSGRGAVRSSRSGITCRPRCSASFPSYAPVTLTATPAKGWKFRSWSGACRGAKRTCTVPMSAATSARARFARA